MIIAYSNPYLMPSPFLGYTAITNTIIITVCKDISLDMTAFFVVFLYFMIMHNAQDFLIEQKKSVTIIDLLLVVVT